MYITYCLDLDRLLPLPWVATLLLFVDELAVGRTAANFLDTLAEWLTFGVSS